jgi:hypothetical protein
MTRAQLRSFRRTKRRFIRWLEPQPIGPILLPLLRSAWFILKSLIELILGVTGLSLFLLLTPIALPIAILQINQDNRHRRITVRAFPCLNCGKPLGERSLELADRAWAPIIDQYNQWDNANPGFRSRRISRTIDAICPHCTQPHRYDLKTHQFVLDPANTRDQSNRSDSPKSSPSH